MLDFDAFITMENNLGKEVLPLKNEYRNRKRKFLRVFVLILDGKHGEMGKQEWIV
mgnify:CR=1 FL=1